jgi:hypothetical protein
MLRFLFKSFGAKRTADGYLSDPVLRKGEALSRRARLWMIWERFAPVLALAAMLAALFVAGAFAGLWQRIGDPWRLIALITALYVLIRAGLAARTLRMPTKREARRRVERDSGAPHRPLETLRDRAALNAQSENGQANLWARHQAKARIAAEGLSPAIPVPVIAPKDRYYLRFIAPALVLLAGFIGYGDNQERLRRALTPSWQSALDPAGVTFDAWVDPPDYTGRPPVYFKGKQTIDIPEGSELVARVQGAKDAPRLKLLGKFGLFNRKYLSLNRLGPDSFEARTRLERDAKAVWRIGQKRREWTLNVIPDRAPQVSWTVEPRADKRDRLSFQYSLSDDYGVERLQLEMRLLSGASGDPQKTVNIPLTGSSVRETDGTDAAIDLTKHVWAGRKVAGRLVAIDGKGLTAKSSEAYFTIADKIFIEPIAKAAAEQRQLIIAGLSDNDGAYRPFAGRTAKEWDNQPRSQDWDYERTLGRAPAAIQRAAALMEAITDYPMGLYNDPAVYMGLRHSLSTLRHANAPDALADLPADLWGIAIRAEYGVLGTALEEMREAQANLNEGMARRAPQREIDTLFERYNEAVDRYVEELTNNAEDAEDTEEPSGGGGRNVDEIAELLKAIEQANKEGDSEGARQLLKKLAEFLENMKIQMAQGGQGGEGGDPSDSMSDEMKESLEDLADLLGEERELKDETEQAQRQAEAGQNEAANSGQGDRQPQSGQEQGSESAGGENPGEQALSLGELAERQTSIAELLDAVRKKLDEDGSASAAGNENGPRGAGEEDTDSQDGNGGEEDNPSGLGGGADEPDAESPRGGGNGNDGEPARDADSALDEAAQAMRSAQEALRSGDLDAAQDAQAKAIATLREAARNLLAQANAGEGDGEEGDQRAGNGEGNPLDQDGDSNNDFSEADLEQRDNAERSREILEELRRRAAEQEREQSEKDYLDGLLKRF